MDAEPRIALATNLPTQGRLIGVDFGTVRIGLAITDLSQQWASPLQTYEIRTLAADEKFFKELSSSERVAGYVVGLPIHLNGRDSAISVKAEEFARWLQQTTQVPVLLFDERFTSSFADELIRDAGVKRSKRKGLRDKLAAQILLTAYLESRRDVPRTFGSL